MSKSVSAIHLKSLSLYYVCDLERRWRATKLTVLAISRIEGELPEINGCIIIIYGHVWVTKNERWVNLGLQSELEYYMIFEFRDRKNLKFQRICAMHL